MRRGTAYWVNLGEAIPPELGKLRPGLVVSATIHNERLDSVVVVPLSTRPPDIWPLRVRLDVRGLKTSYAVLPGIRQVSKARLHEPIGPVAAQHLARIDDALALYLND
jgi:mRNA-degrading endonuclease toxin of MazEF toxin-antitoxin module